MKILGFLLFSGLVFDADGFGVNFWKYRSTIERQTLNKHKTQHLSSQFPNSIPSLDPHLMLQPLDHFDPQVKITYGQRYWVNSEHWKPPNGPVFLYIGGEGSLSEHAAEIGAYVAFAAKYGALIFAVEHRFYGESLNDDGLKLENLKYLSSQQALADLANFHFQISKSYNLTEKNRWISFGGSYPGSLSAWFRIKYPHLVYAAVASSAPVRALVNFDGYCDVVARSLATEIVGGSQKCADLVKTAFKSVDDLIQKRKLSQLENDFMSCKPFKSDYDVLQMVSNLADWFMGTVQYNNRKGNINIKGVCEIMTNGTNAYQNLASLNKRLLESSEQNCSDNSWENFINQLSNVSLDRTKLDAMRQWTYQTCSQFGYYQTCDDDNCLFSHYMTLPPNLDICQTVFNLSPKEVYDRVDFTNAYYGSDDPQGSRILFVNGLIDPWHALSVLDDISKSELAIVIPGTSHCADMDPDKPDDPPALTQARTKINDQIGEWLSEEHENVKFLRKSNLREIVQSNFQKL